MKKTHWIWMAGLLLTLSLAQTVRVQAADDPKTVHKNVNADEFEKLSKNADTVILDVRSPQEYARGHIKNSVLINFNAKDFDEKIKQLDKGKTYLVHCAVGGRSAKACDKLDTYGFAKVVNLEGGSKNTRAFEQKWAAGGREMFVICSVIWLSPFSGKKWSSATEHTEDTEKALNWRNVERAWVVCWRITGMHACDARHGLYSCAAPWRRRRTERLHFVVTVQRLSVRFCAGGDSFVPPGLVGDGGVVSPGLRRGALVWRRSAAKRI